MSHINNITRATKAYHIIDSAASHHGTLFEMIDHLHQAESGLPGRGGSKSLHAALKALTGRSHKIAIPRYIVREFFHALGITGNCFQEKIELLNEFGNDIRLEDEDKYRDEVRTYGAPYEFAKPSGARS